MLLPAVLRVLEAVAIVKPRGLLVDVLRATITTSTTTAAAAAATTAPVKGRGVMNRLLPNERKELAALLAMRQKGGGSAKKQAKTEK